MELLQSAPVTGDSVIGKVKLVERDREVTIIEHNRWTERVFDASSVNEVLNDKSL